MILFDTGSSGTFVDNAEQLSIKVDSFDVAVLSHHHFDHGGGLKRFFELNSNAKVYLADAPDGECFIKIMGFLKNISGWIVPSWLITGNASSSSANH